MPRLNSLSPSAVDSGTTFGTIETGYLSRANGVLHVQTLQTVTDENGKESRQQVPVEFADFDIQAKYVVQEDAGFTWVVSIIPRGYIGTTPPEDQLTSATLANVQKLDAWLAAHGVSYGEPTTGSIMHRFKPGTRIMRYIKAQRPPLAQIRQQIGYHADLGMFLTTEGAILPGEIAFDHTVPYRPAAMLRHHTASPFSYGFAHGGMTEVRNVLREVLGFHDETATALFASWNVMSLVKNALEGYVDHFPVFAVEAPSGTGKTKGAFAMLGKMLTGYSLGESQNTTAALRDMLASTWSGFVHVDDLDDPKGLFELLRLATGAGTKAKKTGQGWDQNAQTKITGGLYITGEHLGMDTEKAMMDRVILISLPSPIHRKSKRPGREHLSQEQDMKEIQRRYQMVGGLTSISATVVSEVTSYVDELRNLVDTLKPCPGRLGDKFAVLLTGARMIDRLLDEEGAWDGEGPTAFYVQQWVNRQLEQQSFDGDNSLTTEVIPTVFGLDITVPDKFRGVEVKFPPCGIAQFGEFEGDRLFIQLTILATVWEAWKGAHNVKQRTETRKALEQQARAAGFERTEKMVRLPGRRDLNPQRLWVATEEVTEAMRERLGR